MEFWYRPIWHAPTQKITAYLCETLDNSPESKEAGQIQNSATEVADFLAIRDMLSVCDVVEKSRDGSIAKASGGIAIPLHMSTLTRQQSANHFCNLLKDIRQPLTKSLLWELVDVAIEKEPKNLARAVNVLRELGRVVLVRLKKPQLLSSNQSQLVDLIRAAGIRWIGIDVEDLEGSEKEKLDLLDRLAALTLEREMNCYGHGFDSMSMMICAASMGYQHLSGTAVSEPLPKPAGFKAKALEAIYGRMLEKKPAAKPIW